MHNFRELKVWKMGVEISKTVFQITRLFPVEERYSLASQLTRCAISIPSNIAEGCGRNSKKELNQFLNISLGSAFELETQLIIAYEFGYIDPTTYTMLIADINVLQKMITGLKKSIST